MGVVYRAYDTITRRFVALKTISGFGNSTALSLFQREWSVLAGLSHPNIVDILETGQFEENGHSKPFFVMPLLPGMTLDQLIKSNSHRLTAECTVEIIAQTCRGLQVAHDQGLVHRDLKPSNIFVLDDDSVKIIDFGIVHLADVRTGTGMKGTLHYLAPELLSGKTPSPLSDQFSLAVVCYEALTGRKPFARPTEDETAEAIRRHIPPSASEINAAINPLVSRTVHKAMAKQPLHRFSSVREFGEILKRALRNEPVEYFDSSRIQPRIERVKKAQGEGDYQFARDILNELEAEGHIDSQIPLLRIQLDQAMQQKAIRQLLENARTRIEEDEYPLALQKIQEILEIDPRQADALQMKAEVEQRRSEKQVDQWYRLVHQHIGNQLFSQARLGLEEILRLRPHDQQAQVLLTQIDRQEKDAVNLRKEKEQLYESAVQCYHQGEISTALEKLERVLALSRQSLGMENGDREAQYQTLYNQIRSEREAFRNAYADARRYIEDKSFEKALALCAEFLNRKPADPLFKALKLEAEERERQELSAALAEVGRRVESEADLDRQISILEDAARRYPKETHFQESLKLIRERRELINSIVNKARQYEERSQFTEALGQWDVLRNIYRRYPGLDVETERLTRKREGQARDEARSRWVRRIDQCLESSDYDKAQTNLQEASVEFPGDRELASLEKLVAQGIEKRAEATRHLDDGRKLCAGGDFENGIEALRKASALDHRDPTIRTELLNALLDGARALLHQDWKAAKVFVDEALQLGQGNPVARSLSAHIQDQERETEINNCVCEARDLQSAGNLESAVSKVRSTLGKYPGEMRLSQLQATLLNSLQLDAKAASPNAQALSPTPRRNRLSSAVEGDLATGDNPARVGDAEGPAPGVAAIALPAQELPAQPKSGQVRKLPLLRPWHWAASALLIMLAVTVPVTIHLVRRARVSSVQPRSVNIPVELTANVSGVTFAIDGRPAPSANPVLEAGKEYVIEASHEGYVTSMQKFTPSTGAPQRIDFVLQPVSTEPPLSLETSAGAETGRLQIETDAPQAQVRVDGKLVRGFITRGSRALLLKPGKHRIQVLASGYTDSAEREIEVASGATRKEAFSLTALQAQLYLEGAEPGAVVYLDGTEHEAVASDGSLRLALPAGVHKIVLKKENYEDSPTVTREFKLNRTESVSGKELPLQKNGFITFNVTPAVATITLRSGGEVLRVVHPNEPVFLKRGNYAYTIEAENFLSAYGIFSVEPGKATSIGTNLASTGLREPVHNRLLENASIWSHRGNWLTFKGQSYAWLKPTSGAFSVTIEKGQVLWAKKKVEWTLDYRGEAEKIVYSVAGTTLTRQVVTTGPAPQPVKVKFNDLPSVYRFSFDISPDRIVVRDNSGKAIDEFVRPDPGVQLGKIGFRGDISISIEQLR
jgi:serine/threonine-protein kinase